MSVTFALDVIMEEGECSRKIGTQSITKPCNSQCYETQTAAPSIDNNLFKGNVELLAIKEKLYRPSFIFSTIAFLF